MKAGISLNRLFLAAVVSPFVFHRAAQGGSFSTDFSSGLPSGAAVYGTAFVDSTGGAGDNGGCLKLTTNGPNQSASSFVINDLDPGSRIGSFRVSFNLHLGNGSTPPADGISFNFATDLPNAGFNEDGAGTGLTVAFDCFDNSTDNNSEGPEFRIKYGGNIITRRKISTQFQTGSGYVPVVISYSSEGALAVAYNNIVMFTNLFLFSPLGTGARFGFGARTGGSYQEQFIDDLNITTSSIDSNGFYIKGVAPSPPVGVSGATPVQVIYQDQGRVADSNSVTMLFNGAAVAPTVSKPSGITTVSFTPRGLLLPNSVNHVAVNFLLSGTPTTLLYDFAVTNAPLWSLAPLSRPYLPLDTDTVNGTLPLYRGLGYNPLTPTNHLYVVSRTNATGGLSINVLDAATGADLYQMNTNGVAGSSIVLLNIVVADDGAIYAASEATTAASPQLNIYRWADDNPATVPTVVYSGDPGALITPSKRWGDTLAVRGAGLNTQLIMDCNGNAQCAIFAPTNTSYVSNFVATAFSDAYTTTGTAIGRSIQFGPTNTYFLKKRSSSTAGLVAALPLDLIQTGTAPATTVLSAYSTYYGEVGPVVVDLARNLAAGILFVTNTASADHLVVYDISNLASPLEIAQYDFPVTHQKNNNMIGQVILGPDRIFALDGNNGIIAVPITPSTPPRLNIAAAGSTTVLSWSNTVPGFVLQTSPAISPASWSAVALPVIENGLVNFVTNTAAGSAFFQLVK